MNFYNMDPGHFLTNSGSKIPMPKSKKENIAPVKPKLTTTATTTTNYISNVPDEIQVAEKQVKTTRPQTAANNNLVKTTVSKSVPNLVKSTNLIKCKTHIDLKKAAAGTGMKRNAAVGENVDAPATKQSKVASKPVLPYKAKNWDLKSRLTECEKWYLLEKGKSSELESKLTEKDDELEAGKLCIEELHSERNSLQREISELKNEKETLQNDLRSKIEMYDKLYEDSKEFLSRIENLQATVTQKDNQVNLLQKDQSRLRDDLLSKESNIAQLNFTVDDLEFKTKKQKNRIEDLENSIEQLRKENLELQSRLRERDSEIGALQDKLDKSERDNKVKTCNLSDLEREYLRSREKVARLEKGLSDGEKEINCLKDKLERTNSELTEKRASEIYLTNTCKDLKDKLCENEKSRRFLHNAVQDLKGNIRVFCRVRPPIASEKENSVSLCTINFPDEGSLEISKTDPFAGSNNPTSRPKFVKHEFSFDRVFSPNSTQKDVFDELSQLVQSALDGYNVCVFAYGQTGSGKTFTMEGENSNDLRGMIPRTVDHIFKSLKELETIGWEYTVEVSFLEIYNEIIRDLLRNDKEGSSLKIMQVDGKTNEVTIPGLTVMKVESYEDLDRLYLLAHQNRAVAWTSCNERSSRSHSITRIKVTGIHKGRGERCYGSLYLVDLAGSERLSELMSDPRLREMKNINKSLSELGNVILGLLQKQEYIPYRNSKLTHLLQPALGGSSKTLMLVNISPVENCLQETLSSLRFAEKVNKVKTGSIKKQVSYDSAILK